MFGILLFESDGRYFVFKMLHLLLRRNCGGYDPLQIH